MLNQGLKGIVAAETLISHVDGEKGKLIYRGYDVLNITKFYTFEETAFLLWYGRWPSQDELAQLKNEMQVQRALPCHIEQIIKDLPKEMDLMSVIRTCISSEGNSSYDWKPTINQAIRLTSMFPTIIAYRKRLLEGKPFVYPRTDLSHIENYLNMLNGELPIKAHVQALETYMILTMEHGMNASTFSARVTASTESDIVSAITSAIGTMKGPLHGGAPSEVLELLDEIAVVGDVEKVIRAKLSRGERLMGFGHRIYKTRDPRAIALKANLLDFVGNDQWLDLALEVEEKGIKLLAEYKPGRELYTNVEFYAAAIMKAIHMEPELFTPTFSASRVVGWSAHVLEQAENNVIFRPQSKYIGPFFS
ncbi:citrate synthase/methylcitrate synthase [Bacillus sp. CGMCC 1.16607]|uniref:citrate synthase/methylcitrate synthase n=1 Tax=Bacillus sp. CGMCC 1.16607 TaxID=3351842 RepID=UPI00362E4CB6